MIAELTQTLHTCFVCANLKPVYYFDGSTSDAHDPKHEERVRRHAERVSQLFDVLEVLRRNNRKKVLDFLSFCSM